jgi:hypothetical protein
MRRTSQEVIYALRRKNGLLGYPQDMMPYLQILVLPDWKSQLPPMRYPPADRCYVWKQLAHVPLSMSVRKHWINTRRSEIDQYLVDPPEPDLGISCDLVEFCR